MFDLLMASITPLQVFELGADAVYLSKRPLPTAPDGHYDWETPSDAGVSPQNHSGLTNVLQEVCGRSLIPWGHRTHSLLAADLENQGRW